MPHGTDQAILGLGDGSVIGTGGNVADADNRLDTLSSDASEVTTAIAAALVVERAAVTAALKVTSVDGAAEATPPGEIYAVTGMSATSVVVAVLHVSTKAAVATIETVDPALFTPGTDTLTSLTEVDRSNDQLLIFWFDV